MPPADGSRTRGWGDVLHRTGRRSTDCRSWSRYRPLMDHDAAHEFIYALREVVADLLFP